MTSVMASVFKTVVMDWPPPKYHEQTPNLPFLAGMIAIHLVVAFAIFRFINNGFYNLTASAATMGSVWALGGFGIAFYYHRMLTHEGFKSWFWLRCLLGACASLLNQGKPAWWAALHFAHHSYSDREGDPHTPNDGFLWAHCITYIFKYEDPYFEARLKKYREDPAIRWQEKYYIIFATMPFTIPPTVGFFLGGWPLAIEMTLASVVGLAAGLHLTWSINSWDHIGKLPPFMRWLEKTPVINFFIGQKTREITPGDRSRNNKFLSTFTFGKGNHEDHHADPQAAYHSGNWDINKWVVLALERLGIIWDVKHPKPRSAKN